MPLLSPLKPVSEDSTSMIESKPGIWAWLMRHWEGMALLGVIAAIVGILVLLLFPPPQQELTLKEVPLMVPKALPLADDSLLAAQEPELIPSEKASPLAKVKRGSHHFAPKKPKHPPITSLNKATLSQLQLLPGIGPKMAQRVLVYRREHGAFTDVSQIMDVKGIGPKKFEKMKPYLKL